MAATTQVSILSDPMLGRFVERAAEYDRENRFFTEDFDELKKAGYLTCAVPSELGGGGLTFSQVMQEQRRLAYHAHATALGINMHVYWTGVAADLWRAGDKSLEWLLAGAVKGEVYAAGHAEKGNVPRSSTRSCRVRRRATASRTRGTCSACAPPRATTRSSRAP
jgi:alkylation response protein AidB-like acyl-CoA dehydrogenase